MWTVINSYIGYNSHHYKPWVTNIPKGQFKLIKCNCRDHSDLVVQSKVIKDRFLERNYDEKLLDKTILEVTNESANCKQKKNEDGVMIPFVTCYSKEALLMKKAIQKNWNILQSDPIIREKLSTKPKIIFRRAPNLQDRITGSYFKEKE